MKIRIVTSRIYLAQSPELPSIKRNVKPTDFLLTLFLTESLLTEYCVSDGMARSRTRHLSFLACSFSLFRFVLEVDVAYPFFRCSLWLALTVEELQSYVYKRCRRWPVRHHGETGPVPNCILHKMKSLVSATEASFLLEADLFAFWGGKEGVA